MKIRKDRGPFALAKLKKSHRPVRGIQFTDRGHLARSGPLVDRCRIVTKRHYDWEEVVIVLRRPVFVIESSDSGEACEACDSTGFTDEDDTCDACQGAGREAAWIVSARCANKRTAVAVVDDVRSVCGSSLEGRNDPDWFLYTIVSGEGADEEARKELREAGYRVEVRE